MLSSRAIAQAARVSAPRASMAPRIAIRSYAQAASEASTKPPLAMYGVDGTYASALWTASAKTSTIDATAAAIEKLNQTFEKDPKLELVLNAPTLSSSDKTQIITELLKSTGAKDGVLKGFLQTLADNNRLGVLKAVCENYRQLMGAYKGEIELVVTSAAPLDAKVLRQLEGSISKSQYVGSGKKLKVVPKVNPEIKGGLIVEIGDRTIDLSVASKMAKMNKLLTDTL
ncbi:OSCP-domain-containing protein [Aulographum hederae CBS 113979]|uniref:ATP synthase subunit 5, mitochondrial n=1 Tax=Aulographum hederae CBS 113979 TaxID=1176131 RepID=A0A6G1H7U8_9PEZI|nr:OSCP-domain-containing protein [Aulographum hederae CBS 113979]